MKENDGLFDIKHLRLWRISAQADLFSKIIFVIYVLSALGQIFKYSQTANTQYHTDLLGLFSQNPIFILDLLLQVARVSLQGIVYYLVLKGVGLGLNMIVETDINYREQKVEGGEE